ncbi:MAG: hypothetical protein RL660_2932 [Bacteroidota bacterium]|jgi:hypothetical protein
MTKFFTSLSFAMAILFAIPVKVVTTNASAQVFSDSTSLPIAIPNVIFNDTATFKFGILTNISYHSGTKACVYTASYIVKGEPCARNSSHYIRPTNTNHLRRGYHRCFVFVYYGGTLGDSTLTRYYHDPYNRNYGKGLKNAGTSAFDKYSFQEVFGNVPVINLYSRTL